MKTYSLLTLALMGVFISCRKENNSDAVMKNKIDSLLSVMTLEEKAGQLTLFTSGWDVTGPVMREEYRQDIASGRCGNLLNAHGVSYNRELQKLAVEESRLGIPLLFGYDVIHGFKTIFPIPLAEACSWDTALVRKTAALSAREAAAAGLNWTFNPMVDLCRDPRWGRIAEGSGEDPFLGGLMAAARVKGYQGTDLSDPYTLAACVKHFAAYGAPEGGRDYNTVDMSERVLREIYLPPYKAAIDAGVASLMTSFNELDGIPATGNRFLLTEILREEWGFGGMVVTDYTSINEMINHGYARDVKHAGELALSAGVDMDMAGAVFYNYLEQSLEEGKITEEMINRSVRRVLEMKYKLGLFDDPFRYLDEERENSTLFAPELMEHALESARKSIVLLENRPFRGMPILPLQANLNRIALIGPLAHSRIDMLGTWHASGDTTKVVTLKEGLENQFPNTQILHVRGCSVNGTDRSGFGEALSVAMRSDVVVVAVGENYMQSGEAASRAEPVIPGVQKELVDMLLNTGKPVVVVVMAGRPLILTEMADKTPALVYAWHLGTRAGDAIADVLSGEYNPSGKLVVSFPWSTGQIPVYYNHKNTGRPMHPFQKYTSKYLDIPNNPRYPFGYGLSYTSFEYSELQLSDTLMTMEGSLNVSVQIKNTGEYAGEETAQLYVRNLVGSVTRPVKELKGFRKVWLEPGEETTVTFTLTTDDLRFYTADMEFAAEPGEFRVFAGSSSVDVLEAGFTLK